MVYSQKERSLERKSAPVSPAAGRLRGCFVLSSMKETCSHGELTDGEARAQPRPATHTSNSQILTWLRLSLISACPSRPRGAWEVDLNSVVVASLLLPSKCLK